GLEAPRAAAVDVVELATPDEDGRRVLAEVADRADVSVDALAGTGVRAPLRRVAGEPAGRPTASDMQAPPRPEGVAVDLPSGVDADTGAVAGPVLPDDLTVTLGGAKAGLLLPPGDRLAGELRVVPLGLEEALAVQPPLVSRLVDADVADLWPVPEAD